MVVQVLMGEGQGVDALEKEGAEIVDDELRSAGVVEAGGESAGEVEALVGAAEEGDAAVGGDDAAGEVGLDGAPREALGCGEAEDRGATVRAARRRMLCVYKSWYHNDLEGTDRPSRCRV